MTIVKRELVIPPPIAEAQTAKAEAEVILSITQAFKVESAEDFQAANVELQTIKNKAREIEKKRTELKAPILEAGRKVDELFKPALAVLASAEFAIKNQMIAWQRGQERIRREAEEAARKEIEKAERARLKAMEKGDEAKVAKAEEKVASIAASVAAVPIIPEAKGFYITEIWSATVVDFKALVKAAAKDDNLLGCLTVNRAVLDDLAKVHKETLSIPGVIAVKRDSAGSRSR